METAKGRPLEGCDGGPVIDRDGNVIGMAFVRDDSILAVSTMLTCIEMWTKYSRIARPIHGLHLRTVELLDVSLRERISLRYNINSGYVVDKVPYDSAAERLGIRHGDVIVSFDELGVHSLPKLEDLLLSLGWEFLQRGFDSSTVVDLKLEVYDLTQLGSWVMGKEGTEEDEEEEEGELSPHFVPGSATDDLLRNSKRIITLPVGFSAAKC